MNNDTESLSSLEALAARLADEDASYLLDSWRELVNAHSGTQRELWLLLMHDGEPTPVLTQIDELPPFPDPLVVEGLMHTCRHFTDEDSAFTFAFCLVRPGYGQAGPADRRWAAALVTAAREAQVPIETIHHANAHAVQAFTPDALIGAT